MDQDAEENESLPGPEPPLLEAPVTAQSAPQKSAAPTPKSKPKRGVSRGRRIFRWFLVLLIIFGLGVLSSVLLLYVPLRDSVSKAQNNLSSADQQVKTLQNRVDNLSSLDQRNQELQGEMQQAALHLAVLSARNDIANARIALFKNDPDGARSALAATPKTLGKISQLQPDQADAVKTMQDRLNLALKELDSDQYAAQSDLDVLATALLQLENTLFAAP